MLRASLLLLLASMPAAPVLAAQDDPTQVPAFVPPENAAICRGAEGYAEDLQGARTFLWRPRWIEAIADDDDMRAAAIAAGRAALANGPYSVTDKPAPPPGASPHAYASIGPYWWPNPDDADGLPYVRRDGEVNPERDGQEFDKARLRALADDLQHLALAYHLTRDEQFAEHAMLLVRTWFIAADTRMEPHFEFAQGIPGRVDGRGEGIIEASDLSTIVEALGLLRPSPLYTADDDQALRQWYGDFAVWMATSENGADELAKTNNHGVFYDFYLAHFALFAGAENVVRNIARSFPDFRLEVQMDRQGRFIEELRRTRSWHYSHYVVDGASRLAIIAECVGLDLNSAQLADGRSLRTAYDFLNRYAADPSAWPFPDRDLESGRMDTMRARTERIALLSGARAAPTSLDDLP